MTLSLSAFSNKACSFPLHPSGSMLRIEKNHSKDPDSLTYSEKKHVIWCKQNIYLMYSVPCRLHNSIKFYYIFLLNTLTFLSVLFFVKELLKSNTYTPCSAVITVHSSTKKYIPIQKGRRLCLHQSHTRALKSWSGQITPLLAVDFLKNC